MRLLSSVVLLLSILPAATAQAFKPADVDALANDALRSWEVPGCALVIVHNDKIVLVKGYGVLELGKRGRVTAETVFPLASCTKAFTTTALAMLVDDGKLAWDDPVRKHLAFFRLADPLADTQVTLRDLVTHRTGVAGHDLLLYRAPWTPEESVRRIAEVPPSHSFRSRFQYQSILFTAAGLAVGTASQSTWEEQVRRRIVEPLAMTGTTFTTVEAEKIGTLASPHRRNRQGKVEVVPRYRTDLANAAGSIHGNARDLGRWIQFQLGDGTHRGQRLVSAASLTETHTPQTVIRMDAEDRALHPETVQMSYGMGWVIQDYRGQRLVSHAGIIDGFRSHITLAPNARLGLAILSNSHATRMNLALSNSLVDLFLRVPSRDWNELVQKVVNDTEAARAADRRRLHRPDTKPSLPLEAYAGAYEAPGYGTARVVLKEGNLLWEWSTFHLPLEHLHDDTFLARSELLADPLLMFEVKQGKVHGVNSFDMTFRKK